MFVWPSSMNVLSRSFIRKKFVNIFPLFDSLRLKISLLLKFTRENEIYQEIVYNFRSFDQCLKNLDKTEKLIKLFLSKFGEHGAWGVSFSNHQITLQQTCKFVDFLSKANAQFGKNRL